MWYLLTPLIQACKHCPFRVLGMEVKLQGPFQQHLAEVPRMGSPSLAPSPSRGAPAWPLSHATATGRGRAHRLGQEEPSALSFPNMLQFFHLSHANRGGVSFPSQPPPSEAPISSWSRAPGPPTPDDKATDAMNYPCPVTKPEMCHNSSVNELKKRNETPCWP